MAWLQGTDALQKRYNNAYNVGRKRRLYAIARQNKASYFLPVISKYALNDSCRGHTLRNYLSEVPQAGAGSFAPQAGAGSFAPQAGAGSCVPQAEQTNSFAVILFYLLTDCQYKFDYKIIAKWKYCVLIPTNLLVCNKKVTINTFFLKPTLLFDCIDDFILLYSKKGRNFKCLQKTNCLNAQLQPLYNL